MKKQIKQKENTDAKQNRNANSDGNRTPVSEDTKQKLVQQYQDRAGASSQTRDLPDGNGWGDYDLDKNWVDEDREFKNLDTQYRPSGETLSPEYDPSRIWSYNPVSVNYPEGFEHANPGWTPRDEALGNTHSWQGAADGDGIDILNWSRTQQITPEQLQNIVNAMSNDAAANRENTSLSPNMLYGYGDAPRDFFSRYDTPAEKPEGYSSVYQFLEDEGLDNWVTNSGIADSGVDQLNAARAFQLMQNANDYDRQQNLDQWAQEYRDNQLYGDALMELMAQQQAQNNNRSLLEDALQQIREQEILENRPASRQRHITGPGHF